MINPREVLQVCSIIPVIAIENASDAVPLALALQAGGINIMEITLRTDAAIESIRNVATEVPDMIVGAGTVLTTHQFDEVCEAGAKFVISPGFSDKLLEHANFSSIPLIPGVATASEIVRAMEYGFDTFKLFPANIVGGVDALKSFGGPFSSIKFCPTGGIKLENMNDYLSLENVLCVGGTWLTPKELLKSQKFDAITQLAKEALAQIK
jgi:2-dehydro-3-deoxyphosphogluconate aldolase/(4S)-4-hydroxy-2-oxoglutarate aldolase